jgi:hypothetical protein
LPPAFGARARALGGERRDETERHVAFLRKPVRLQLDTAHCRHLNIRYDARCLVQVWRSQKRFGRRKCMGAVLKRSDEITGRVSNGSIIVND